MNSFSGPSTTVLMNALSTSPSVQTIQYIKLEESTNFEEEDACIALAEFLAAAVNMKRFDISGHKGRKISIEVRVASEDGESGEVIIRDTEKNQVIKEKTSKTKKFGSLDF